MDETVVNGDVVDDSSYIDVEEALGVVLDFCIMDIQLSIVALFLVVECLVARTSCAVQCDVGEFEVCTTINLEVDTLDGCIVVGVQHNVLVNLQRLDGIFLAHSGSIGEVVNSVLCQHDDFTSLGSLNGVHQFKSCSNRCEVG